MRRDSQPRRVWSAALARTITEPVVAVVMGVSGSGKTTVSVLLAAALGCQFQEGDDLRPAANVEKMHGGTPLTDADRMPWLHKIAEEIDGWRVRSESGVLNSAGPFVVSDAKGVPLAYVQCRDDLQGIGFAHNHLTSDEARRIANGIARLPEFMMQRKDFHQRGGGQHRWKKSRPYHVALEDGYIRALGIHRRGLQNE